ncbi:hypothetical protein EON81_05585 [bacterium]|nr:MAG: hypothetical protein EON81_05585 [bacterium]
MLLRSRPAVLEDLLDFQDGLALPYGPAQKDLLPAAWAGLLSQPSIWSLVVEDMDRPAGRRSVFYSMTAFVSAEFKDELLSGTIPFMSGHLVRRYLEVGNEPLKREEMIQVQEGAGLNSINLHSVCPIVPAGQNAPIEIGDYLARQNFEAMRGYRFDELLREVFSSEALQSYLGGGWRVRQGHGDEPTLKNPWLLGFNRAEARETSGARMASMFVSYPIRLGLRRNHRELLQAALDGLTDDEMADRFSVSLSAVKKRWLAVYEHVDKVFPGLLPFDVARTEKGRGAERRRHLLNFLRDHPEEFRSLED